MIKVRFSKSFKKKYKPMDKTIQNNFREKIELLLKYGLDYPSLRIHKLKGKALTTFSLSINMNFRATFYKDTQSNCIILEFFSIGKHDLYKNIV